MNLKEQQYVCTLARCQSLSRAAEELFISPSALSVYISNLEKYLGVRLFERTGRGKAFVLTSIGEEYVVRAEKMLELKALLLSAIEEHPELSEEERGNLLGECDLTRTKRKQLAELLGQKPYSQ